MKKTYYLFNPGRMSRKDNTLKFVPVDEEGKEGVAKYIPVEGVSDFYCFGSLDANSSFYNFLGKQNIAVHFFDYYEHYSGSFMPKDYLLAGKMQIAQTTHYLKPKLRMEIAGKIVSGSGFNMSKVRKYYLNRGKELEGELMSIENLLTQVNTAVAIDELMGIEGNIRQYYYKGFDKILNDFLNK